MQLKHYEAASIQEAMSMIRKELGDDAVILSTHRKGNGFEVLAARDRDPRPVERFRIVRHRRRRESGFPRDERRWGNCKMP
jgi:flagellar biosynthesis GTPase FlhF